MAFPTLPSSWTAPTTCFASTDIWAVIVSHDPQTEWKYYFGVPATTPTGNCLPPSYATSQPYIGQTCPPGYRNAFASRTTIYNQQAEATLCYPRTDYSFEASRTPGYRSSFDNQTFIRTFTDPFIGTQRPASFSSKGNYTLSTFGITIVSIGLCRVLLDFITNVGTIKQALRRQQFQQPHFQALIPLLPTQLHQAQASLPAYPQA
ncbi:hypothetical protein F5Y10DRAFT_102021 [Nemania abortiva]|nr:hypothetical protein F5Y10DRAFT_102021 [Nemania abortiva]